MSRSGAKGRSKSEMWNRRGRIRELYADASVSQATRPGTEREPEERRDRRVLPYLVGLGSAEDDVAFRVQPHVPSLPQLARTGREARSAGALHSSGCEARRTMLSGN